MTGRLNIGAGVKFLYDLEYFGIKLGLKNISALLAYSGNPENSFRSVHVAGTNGKGSTASLIASALTASGYRTGLYTSPHIRDFTERIRIDGVPIARRVLASYIDFFSGEISNHRATFFEAATAIAFKYFADSHVDIAVIETGLGGRWDATNVLTPVASVITNIGIEHEEHLGKTHLSIALEKGGIIKESAPCFTATENPTALKKIKEIARSRKTEVVEIRKSSEVSVRERSIYGTIADIRTRLDHYRKLEISLAGEHQVENARLAILVLEYLKRHAGYDRISRENIYRGFRSVRKNSGLYGRLEVISESPLVIGDVAHNAEAARSLALAISRLYCGKLLLVFGVMKDKRLSEMIRYLKPITRFAVAVQPGGRRALDKRKVLDAFNQNGIRGVVAPSCSDGVRIAASESVKNEPILVTGSHFVLAEIVENIKYWEDNTCFFC